MPLRIDTEQSLNALTSAALESYLRSRNWEFLVSRPRQSKVFGQTVRGRRIVVHVPIHDAFADHAESMQRAIGDIAMVEERSEYAVFNDLNAVGSDTITVSALAPSDARQLGLHDAAHLFRGTFRVLSAAARSARQPRAAHRGPPPAEADRFLNKLMPGSFGLSSNLVTVYSPVKPELGQGRLTTNGGGGLGSTAPEPFSSRVVAMVAQGLLSTRAAIDEARANNDPDPFLRAVDSGVSANLCAGLAQLVEYATEYGRGAELAVRWAPLRRLPNRNYVAVAFTSNDHQILVDAQGHLRSTAIWYDERLRAAEIVRLEREPDEFDGSATLIADFDGRPRRFAAKFDERDYRTIIDAFRKRLRVEVDGNVHPTGRTYELRNPRNVRIMDEPNP